MTLGTLGYRSPSPQHDHSGIPRLPSIDPTGTAQIVKHYAVLAGLDPASFAGHSLRAGFLTSAAESGASVLKMVEVSRHKSIDMLRTYVRRADLFREHAGAAFL